MQRTLLRDDKGRFVSTTKRQIVITDRLFKRYYRPETTRFYESPNWFSNGIWAVRKDNIKDLPKAYDIANKYEHISKTDNDFFDCVNYEKQPFNKTLFLKDFKTDNMQNCYCRIFKNTDDQLIYLNDELVTMLKIDKLCYGKKEKI